MMSRSMNLSVRGNPQIADLEEGMAKREIGLRFDDSSVGDRGYPVDPGGPDRPFRWRNR
jgi:hypothetical protein